MTGIVYNQLALIDTSAVIALSDSTDQFHRDADSFFCTTDFVWVTLDVTAHETFTRVRYDAALPMALGRFDFLRSEKFRQLTFERKDERQARRLLQKYTDQTLSFHDALCAATMMREGIYRIFTFDSDFWIFGFEVMPGRTK